MITNAWEVVHRAPGPMVRRFRVPGGWLYQVEAPAGFGWYHPTFVAQSKIGSDPSWEGHSHSEVVE